MRKTLLTLSALAVISFVYVLPVNAQTPTSTTKIRQSFITQDGTTIYFRSCEFDGTAGIPKADTCTNFSAVNLEQDLKVPGEKYGAYATFVFNQGGNLKIRQSFIAQDGKTQRFRTCDFNNETGIPVNCPASASTADLSNLRGVGDEAYSAYELFLFNNGTKIRRSLITLDGTTQYFQSCDFNSTTGLLIPETCSNWGSANLESQNGVPGEKYSAYATFVYQQGDLYKIRQSYIATNGFTQRFRTCAFNNVTGAVLDCPEVFSTTSLDNVRGAGSETYSAYEIFLFPLVPGMSVPVVTVTPGKPELTISPTEPDISLTPVVTVTSGVPSPTLDPDCQLRPKGDADCDEDIDQIDYQIWRCELLNGGLCTDVLILPTGKTATDKWANFTFQKGDTVVDLADFETWRKNTDSYVIPTLEPTLTTTPALSPTDIPVTPSPIAIVPTVAGGSGTPAPTKAPTAVPTATKTPAPTPTPSYRSKILFTSNRSGKSDIMVKELNGDERMLTATSQNNYEPQISADGQKIVFYSYRDLNQEIYIMNSDGTNEIRLTNDPAIDIDPTINADGTKIVFATTRHGGGNYELYMMDTDGSNLVRLTNKAGHDTQPHFSPDGNKIVFTSTRDGNHEIYTLDLTKPNADPNLNYDPQRWTDSPDVDYEPAFHPTDNNKIIFNSNRATYYRIFSTTLERTAAKRFPDVLRLNIIGNYTDLEPSFSGDGSRIIFRSNRAANYEIWVVDPTGQNHNRVTFNTETDTSPVFFP